MKNLVMFAVLSALVSLTGCATMGEVTVRKTDGTVVYTDVPVRRGEIHMGSFPDKTVEADIFLDGQELVTNFKGKIRPVGPIRSGENVYDIWVDRIGEHNLSGKVYLREGGRRADYIGPIDITFYVDPRNRDWSATAGHWWKVEVYPP